MLKKKLIAILSVICIIFTFSSCNINNDESSHNLNITSTIFPPYDFAREIAGDNANVQMLLNPGTESHTYEPTPKDIIKIQKSDIFIYIGGESEEWVTDILNTLDTSQMTVIRLMDYIEPLEEDEFDSEEDLHHDDEGHKTEYDEHIWTSPKNAIIMTEKITDSICKCDKENEELYRENEKKYTEKLNKLDEEFSSIVKNGKRNTIVFGDRFPFAYFAKDYSLNYYAAFPGCSSESEPSAATMAQLIDVVTKENIPVVFYVEMSNQKVADTICEATNAKKLLFHSCHTLTKDEIDKGENYISIMKSNCKNLKEALTL